jgi:hypothetical protein
VYGFGRHEFQLMLLRRMEDFHPDLVSGALRQVGATKADLRAAHRRWQELLRSRSYPRDLRRFELALGRPDAQRSVPFGDVEVLASQWALPVLWPDLAWEVVTTVDGMVLHEWLVRVSGGPEVPLDDLGAIPPWTCVVADLTLAHPAATQADLQVASRWGVVVGQQLATFVWGLVQEVSDLPEISSPLPAT